jgi:hypothetical protein
MLGGQEMPTSSDDDILFDLEDLCLEALDPLLTREAVIAKVEEIYFRLTEGADTHADDASAE